MTTIEMQARDTARTTDLDAELAAVVARLHSADLRSFSRTDLFDMGQRIGRLGRQIARECGR